MFARPFETENKSTENKNRVAGIIVTLVVHGLLFLLLFFLYITPPDPPFGDNAGGTAVNFGTVDEGMGDQQQFTAVPVKIAEPVKENAPTPPPATATKSPEELETQEKEDAAVVETKPVVKKERVKPIPEATYKPTKVTKPAEPTPPKPKVNSDALFSGAQGTPNKSTGDGTGHKKGDQGKQNGDVGSQSYKGNGTGNGTGDGPGSGIGPGGYGGGGTPGPGSYRLTGRKRLSRPSTENPCTDSRGRITIAIKVNKLGKVIDAQFSQSGSTTADDCLVNLSKREAMQWVFDPKADAEDVQVGSILFEYGYKH